VQTNTYFVPADKRDQHEVLMRRFRQTLGRLGCQHFAVYEQVGPGFSPAIGGQIRFVQVMTFRDRRQHQVVQEAERSDKTAQELIREFCEMIDLPSQQAQGTFAVDYYSVLPDGTA
jgi:hypothetical protein